MHESTEDGEIVHPVSGNRTEICERHYIAKGKLQSLSAESEDNGGTTKFSSKTQFLTQPYAGEKIVGARTFGRPPLDGEEVETLPIPQPILPAGAKESKDSKGDGDMVDAKGEGRGPGPVSKAEQKA